MRCLRLLTLVLAVALFGCAGYNSESVARATLGDLVARRYDDVHHRFSPNAARAIPLQQIQLVWGEVLTALGDYSDAGRPLPFKVGDNNGYDYPLRFRRGLAHVQVVVDTLGRVIGLIIRPGTPSGRFGT